jgi:chromosome segregation ATPase
MDQQFQAKQTLVTIQADINLLERKKTKILQEIEHLQATKAEAFKQHDQQIKHKQDAADHLTNEGKRLQALAHLYSQSVEDLEKEIAGKKAEKEQLIAEAEIAVKTIHDEADNRIKAVADREKNATEREEEIDHQQKVIALRVKHIVEDGEKLEQKQEELLDRKFALAGKEAAAKEAVAQAQELLDDITRQINEKRMQSQTLDQTIENKTREVDRIGKEAEVKLQELDRLIAEYTKKEEMQSEKAIELNKKERWLDDREATVGRAYRETLQRGGKVN